MLPFVLEVPSPPEPLVAAATLSGLPALVLLESAARDNARGRYSYLTADPFDLIRSDGGRTFRETPERGERRPLPTDPIDAVRELLAPFRHEPLPGLPPFQGGAAGYVGYHYGALLETIPPPRNRDVQLPDVILGVYDWVLAWDHATGGCWIISTGLPDVGEARARRARQRAELVQGMLVATPPKEHFAELRDEVPAGAREKIGGGEWSVSLDRAAYETAVREAIRLILAGDIFQVNLSRRLSASIAGTAFQYYRRLREATPAPFAAWLDYGAFQVASASPERFLQYDPTNRRVETRPIKGTRPRGRTADADRALGEALLASEKDRAENVMIVDLLRNDLSKVCLPGTVGVPELLVLEPHPTVHHLVSTVTGTLEQPHDAGHLLKACFPGGSITGAPKIRAMEIIAALEPVAREVYTGAIGWWSLTGAMDTSIAIRTAMIRHGLVHLHGGGGIVADSDPAAEFDETVDKIRAMAAALADREA